MNKYEAMFLLDPSAAANWDTAEAEVRRLLDRASANVLGFKKWDERKLAYEVKRRKRGTYVLVYFEAPSDKIGSLERDANISEIILRLLVLRHERLAPEAIEKALTASPPPRSPERTGDFWSPRGPSRGDRGDRDRDRGRGRDRDSFSAPRGAEDEPETGFAPDVAVAEDGAGPSGEVGSAEDRTR